MDAEPEREVTRRTLLSAGAVIAGGAGLAAIAGCGPKTAAAQGSSSVSSGGSDVVTPAASVPVGNGVLVKFRGQMVVVAQPESGDIVAFSAICTHQGCIVAPAGLSFHCPCHGSTYDAATGAVTHGPATRPLPKIAVSVQGGNVVAT